MSFKKSDCIVIEWPENRLKFSYINVSLYKNDWWELWEIILEVELMFQDLVKWYRLILYFENIDAIFGYNKSFF
jgi:hypothetical protein